MGCELCGKSGVPLSKGLYNNSIALVCNSCANMEGILLIGKPSQEQLEKAEKRETVRQTMERLSGQFLKRPIANIDHDISERSMEKIKVVPKAPKVEELIDNYDWEIRMARRRKKMTARDLAKATGISVDNIDRIERGYLPKDFSLIMAKIENILGIKLLKGENSPKIKFNFPKKQENTIDLERIKQERLAEVEKRKEMQAKTTLDLSKHRIEENKQQTELPMQKSRTALAMERLHSIDKPRKFEKSDGTKKDVKDVNFNDLVDRKIKQDQDMIGNDVELEE